MSSLFCYCEWSLQMSEAANSENSYQTAPTHKAYNCAVSYVPQFVCVCGVGMFVSGWVGVWLSLTNSKCQWARIWLSSFGRVFCFFFLWFGSCHSMCACSDCGRFRIRIGLWPIPSTVYASIGWRGTVRGLAIRSRRIRMDRWRNRESFSRHYIRFFCWI